MFDSLIPMDCSMTSDKCHGLTASDTKFGIAGIGAKNGAQPRTRRAVLATRRCVRGVRGGATYKTGFQCQSENPSPPSSSFILSHPLHERLLTFTLLPIMKFIAAIPFVLAAVLQAVAQTADAMRAAELVADLKRAPTQVARLDILKDNKDVSTRSRSTQH